MLRFLFHTDGRHGLDDQSFAFATIDQAKCKAVRLASDIIGARGSSFWGAGDFKMSIVGEDGRRLFMLTLSGVEDQNNGPTAEALH